VATNALIQHRGVRTGLITTDGFRDLLEIGRQKRPDLYDLQIDKPPVLVPRDLRWRCRSGCAMTAASRSRWTRRRCATRCASCARPASKAVAVCFLYGFVDTDARGSRAAHPGRGIPRGVRLRASHEVAPEFREFERLSTTVVNAYLGPVMRATSTRLAERLAGLGMRATPHLTQSNGGVIGFEQAARLPVRTVLSGPSTGVVGAQAVGRWRGYPDLITFDMGGTSTDVALLQGGACRWRARRWCMAIRSRRRCWTSTPSAPAADRSRSSIPAGC
jgi:N-methylhydantoinase A